MLLKNILSFILIFYTHQLSAQRIIYSANFENKKIDSSSWQIVTGNWSIGDVQELRIAPAGGGYRYMLMSGGKGYIGDNIIRLILDLPDSIKSKKLKLSFYYYIIANTSGTKIEGEFYQKEIKDGLRGRIWVADLPRVNGRWTKFQKTLNIPAGANSIRIVFYGLDSSGKKDRIICVDNIILSSER